MITNYPPWYLRQTVLAQISNVIHNSAVQKNAMDPNEVQEEPLHEGNFWSIVRGRRSVRRYRAQPIEQPVLEAVLEAARWAPSAHNRQPWRFAVVVDPAVKGRMSDRMGQQWRSDLQQDGADPNFIERRVAISHARITGAGALIIACVSMEEMDTYSDAERNNAEWLMAVQSVALACQNLLLAAHAHGLGACWMCAPLFVPHLVRDVLDLPDAWHPQALITLGYPAEGHSAADKESERKSLDSIVVWR